MHLRVMPRCHRGQKISSNQPCNSKQFSSSISNNIDIKAERCSALARCVVDWGYGRAWTDAEKCEEHSQDI
eukprot:5667469-Ditylum_brightwellii.AAC.1